MKSSDLMTGLKPQMEEELQTLVKIADPIGCARQFVAFCAEWRSFFAQAVQPREEGIKLFPEWIAGRGLDVSAIVDQVLKMKCQTDSEKQKRINTLVDLARTVPQLVDPEPILSATADEDPELRIQVLSRLRLARAQRTVDSLNKVEELKK